jgi:hypothetical protein
MPTQQVVTAKLRGDTWHVVKVMDGSTFALHTIPVTAFEGWARSLNTKDAQLVLDAVLHAPYLQAPTLAEVERVKTNYKPSTLMSAGAINTLATQVGLATDLRPNGDPLPALLTAAQKGVQDAGKVQEVLVRPDGGTGGSGAGLDGGEPGQQHQPTGVADNPGSLPPGGRRRVVASQQAVHW